MTLSRTLNGFFSTPRQPKPQPGRYVAIRGDQRLHVAKVAGVWRVTDSDDAALSSVLLGELKATLRDRGFDMLRAADQ
jgi:hypothetical protein